MRNANYLLLFAALFLVSCAAQKIPFKSVPNEDAQKMYKYYLDPTSSADHSFKEVPKILSLDKKTLKTFTKAGKADEVKFILAAYLPGTTPVPLNKNTILLQIMSLKDGLKVFSYYDLRQQLDPKTLIVLDNNDTVCPKPDDCGPTIEN